MRVADYIRLLFLAAIWGASFLFMRISSPEFGVFNTAFLRVFFGFAGLAVILFFLNRGVNFEGKLTSSLTLGVINSGIPFIMYCFAAKWLPAGYSAVLNATTPLMGTLIGCAFFGEKLTARKWIGVILGVVGIMVMTTFGESRSTSDTIAGVVVCLVATGCYGVAGFLTRRWIANKGGCDPKIVAFGSQLGATLFLLPFFIWGTLFGPSINWSQGDVWASVLALGIICTAFAYILYFRLIADIGPLRSLTVTFLIPPFAVLWGYIFLGETINEGFIFGAFIVCVSVWLVVSPGKERIALTSRTTK
ncbi:DMT family transporter [Klebsiella sp. B345]|uniref:DMT family transporter n=1 Tax=Klebsiella sp. B345 TaxID=2755398 RepID=UPI003DA8BB42